MGDTLLAIALFYNIFALSVVQLFFLTAKQRWISNRPRYNRLIPSYLKGRPILDWAFIWKQFAFITIVIWATLRFYELFPNHVPTRTIMWGNLCLAETSVIYFIYQERLGHGYIHTKIRSILSQVKR